MPKYYYIRGKMGMTSNGSFTRDKNRWITFNKNDVMRIGNNKPYAATKKGLFVDCNKF